MADKNEQVSQYHIYIIIKWQILGVQNIVTFAFLQQ